MDCFTLLDQPLRPWLDVEEVRKAHHARSAEAHPDRQHGQGDEALRAANEQSAALNRAYSVLSDPKERIAHLIELGTGKRPSPVNTVPADMAAQFFRVGDVCRKVDAFLKAGERDLSPLLRAGRSGAGFEWEEQLAALRGELQAQWDQRAARLRMLDSEWAAATGEGRMPGGKWEGWEQLARLYRELGYLNRWLEQVQEREVRLRITGQS